MKVELIYFDLQGRATQTRIMLKMAGIEFTDTRLSKEEFLEKKASFEESALGQLPILKVNDKVRDSSVSDSKNWTPADSSVTGVLGRPDLFWIHEKYFVRVMQSWNGLLKKLD